MPRSFTKWDDGFEELVKDHKVIDTMKWDSDSIRFTFTDGSTLVGATWGDCCSTTWIEDIDDATVIGTGAVLMGIDNVDMPDLGDPDEYTTRKYYGIRFTTSRGQCTLDFRNDSNGYYGGSIDWAGTLSD